MPLQHETLSDLKYQVYSVWNEPVLLRSSQLDIMADQEGAGGLQCHALRGSTGPTPRNPPSRNPGPGGLYRGSISRVRLGPGASLG